MRTIGNILVQNDEVENTGDLVDAFLLLLNHPTIDLMKELSWNLSKITEKVKVANLLARNPYYLEKLINISDSDLLPQEVTEFDYIFILFFNLVYLDKI